MNVKQQAFADEYIKDFNATKAAIRAGYSERSAYSQGQRLLKNDEIHDYVQSRLDEIAMSANEVLIRLAEQARGEHGQYITTKGFIDVEQLVNDGKAYLIKAIKPGAHGDTYEFYDSQNALALLGKHHGLFTDKMDVTSGGEPLKVIIKYADS